MDGRGGGVLVSGEWMDQKTLKYSMIQYNIDLIMMISSTFVTFSMKNWGE